MSLTAFRGYFSRIGLARASLVFVGLMWVLPFLYHVHAYPITTFYQEWGAAMLGLCAMILLVEQRYWQQPEVPRIVMLPIGVMLLVMVQFALGKLPYPGQALLIVLYLLWATLLVMLGQHLRGQFGLPVLAKVLAAFLLLGAELNTVIGVLQHYNWHTFLDPVVVVKNSAAIFGNLAQPNHFANYITLGLVSLGLLYADRRIPAWQVVALAAPLLFVLTLSGSRSPWLYLLGITGMAFLWQRRDKSCLPLLHYSIALLLGFGLMHWMVHLPWLAVSAGSVTAAGRLIEQAGDSNSARFYLWREVWLIFTQFPLLGAGFGQFGWMHFQIGPQLHNVNITGFYNNSHNIVMQFASETGLAGLLILLGTAALWFRQARAAPRTIYHWWGYGLLAVLTIHSMLEYPLWYAYFLAVAAFMLGVLDNTTCRPKLCGAGRLPVAVILLLGALTMLKLLHGYRDLESVIAKRPTPAASAEYGERWRKAMMEVHGESARGEALLQPYAELPLLLTIDANSDHLADKRALNERVMHSTPVGSVVYRQVLLLALAGEQEAAQLQMERAIWSYPDNFTQASEQLRALARGDPAHFAALLEFALRAYEVRERAAREATSGRP